MEVIRGPQGGALYGANSISGVTNIVTRYENPDEGAPRLRLQTGLGRAGSDYGRAALAQDYRAAFRTGSPARSAGANLSLSSLGAFIPGAYGRSLGLTAGARNVGSRSLVSGTFRLYAQSTGTPLSPLLAGIHPTTTSASGAVGGSGTELTPPSATGTTSPSSGESVVEYTLGLNASTAAGKHWTHSAVAGVDGYRLHGVPEETQPFLSAADSALRAAQGGADRATLRLSTVGRYELGQKTNLAVTITAEQSLLRQQTAPDAVISSQSPLQTGGWTAPATTHSTETGPAPSTTRSLETGPAASTTWAFQPRASSSNVQATASTVEIWRNNTGVAAQLDGSYADRFFLTGGLRLERDEDLAGNVHDAALPMLGVAWATDMGPVTLKLRSSYGKGIRLPQASLRELLWATSTARADGANLGPEQQSGIETGFDLFAGRALTVKVTRFDQVASGLVQRVMVDAENNAWGAHGLRYQLQNIGRIGNHGWEMQATTRLGELSATGAFTLVDSRVERVANGYTGELRPGDRALEVPAKTASITGSWAPSQGVFSLTAYRALDWVNYDRLSLAQALVDGRLRRPFLGSDLRNYWLIYPGVTHLRASVSRDLRHGVTLLLTGDNLLDHQRGEPDNITVTPGRTFSFGIRADF